jgi:hypothetical protein
LAIHYFGFAQGFRRHRPSSPDAGQTLLLALQRSPAVKKVRVVAGGIAGQN